MAQCSTHSLAAGPDGRCVLCRREAAPVPEEPAAHPEAPGEPGRSLVSRLSGLLTVGVVVGLLYGGWWWATASPAARMALLGTPKERVDPHAENMTVRQVFRAAHDAGCDVALACNSTRFHRTYPDGRGQCSRSFILPGSVRNLDLEAHVPCNDDEVDACVTALVGTNCQPPEGAPEDSEDCVKCLGSVRSKRP